MIELKTQYPYIDNNGIARANLIKHYAEDDSEVKYYIKQVETGAIYSEAIDIYPSKFTYTATEEKVKEVDNGDRQD